MTVQRVDDATVPALGNERSWILRHGKGFDYMTQNGVSGEYFLGGGTFQGGNAGLDDIGNPADDEENFLSRCHLRGVLASLFEPGVGKSSHPRMQKMVWVNQSCSTLGPVLWVLALMGSLGSENSQPPFREGNQLIENRPKAAGSGSQLDFVGVEWYTAGYLARLWPR